MSGSGDAPLILGWREWLSLPQLGLPRIKAKVDTGARTSALHALTIELFDKGSAPWVRFDVHPTQYRTDITVRCEAPVKTRRSVTNSGGRTEERFVIDTRVRIAGREWPIEVTLTSRNDLRFRMLLGRTALRGKALVDPSRSYLTGGRTTELEQ